MCTIAFGLQAIMGCEIHHLILLSDALMRQLVLRATAMDEQKKLSQLQATLDEVS